jgi:hypothetical protein
VLTSYVRLVRELGETSARNQAILLLTIAYVLAVGPTWAVGRLLRKPFLPFMDWSKAASTYWIERPARTQKDHWKRPF